VEQIRAGNRSIMGLMIESNINGGNQKLSGDPGKLEYGVSVTDGCLDWETTASLLREMAETLCDVLPCRQRVRSAADAA
jgi:3-deoxy-7-phosphoheptulonate synthase